MSLPCFVKQCFAQLDLVVIYGRYKGLVIDRIPFISCIQTLLESFYLATKPFIFNG